MQTNERLFTDRNLLVQPVPNAGRLAPRLPFPESGVGGVLEALAHAALVLILLGAMICSGHHHRAAAAPTAIRTAAPAATPSPAVAVSTSNSLGTTPASL